MNLAEAREVLEGLAGGERRPGEVRLELQGALARLWLDGPRAKNALTLGMMIDLAAAVERLADWEGSVVVVRGVEGSFCSGGHLGDVRDAIATPERGEWMSRAMTTVLDGLRGLPIVSVAAIEGAALGGGAELLTACDVRLAHRDAVIGFVQASLGVAPGWGGARRLVDIVGRERALRILLAAERRRPEVLPDLVEVVDDLDAAVGERVAWLLRHPPAVIRAIKAQVALAPRVDVGEARWFATVWGGPAHQEALRK